MKLTILLLLISLSKNAVADQTRILSGETAAYNGILIDDDWYKELVFKRREYDDLEKKFLELQKLKIQQEEPQDSVLEKTRSNIIWFFIGTSIGILAMEIAR